MPVLNIAAYRFVALADPAAWVDVLRDGAATRALKGTIIVAEEGINLFLAGDAAHVDDFLHWLATDARFVDLDGVAAFDALEVKRSWSDAQPFRRLRIKHKPEIVTMRRPTIAPGRGRAPAVGPADLARWLERGRDDAGRELLLLDTRNAFEVDLGRFDGAQQLGIDRFESFPDAVESLRDAARDRTVVTYCTGGIRCEKAALHMRDAGFAHVVQLDGGILRYFEEVGDRHWTGSCFVFDERRALDATLAVSGPARPVPPT